MMLKTRYYRERGQATREIAIAVVAIVFLVMGFFTFGGIGITSIKSLLQTRYYAEIGAEKKSFGSASGSRQLSRWDYTTVTQKREDGDIRLVIPFLGRDEAVVTKSELSSDYLESETPSLSIRPEQAQAPEDADYYWQSFDGLISRRVLSVNTAVLASLHKQAPVLPDEVNSEQNYLFRLDRDSRELKQQFRSKGWMDLESIDIKDWQSSTVSFPAFAPQK